MMGTSTLQTAQLTRLPLVRSGHLGLPFCDRVGGTRPGGLALPASGFSTPGAYDNLEYIT